MSSGDPATRARILAAARALLEERPGTGPSMGEVAARAGVSRQALYLHFADRSALLLEVDTPRPLDAYLDELTAAFPAGAAVDQAVVAAIQRRHDTLPAG